MVFVITATITTPSTAITVDVVVAIVDDILVVTGAELGVTFTFDIVVAVVDAVVIIVIIFDKEVNICV
jgi:hypothetical protein